MDAYLQLMYYDLCKIHNFFHYLKPPIKSLEKQNPSRRTRQNMSKRNEKRHVFFFSLK